MGVYSQPKSPYWWIRVPRGPGLKPLRESTRILKAAPTDWQRKKQRQDAEEVFAARLSDLARHRHGLPDDKPTITFKAFATWYATHKIPKHRGAEREQELLERLVEFFGPRQLAAITKATVEEYLTKRTTTDKKTAGTANREVDLLKSMLTAAVPTYLDASPIAGMRRLRTVKIRKRVLTAEEETRLLAQLPPRDQVLFIAATDTLVRMTDLLNLKRSADHGPRLELVDSKTGPYVVPVSTRLRAALDSLEANGEYYFWWRRRAATARDRRGAVRQLLQRACKAAVPRVPYGRAIAGITWHTGTRATGATRMLRAGADAKTVQAIGHWASLEQMGEYLQTDMDLMAAAVNLLAAPAAPSMRAGMPAESETTQKRAEPRQRPARRPAAKSGRKSVN